MFFIGSNVQNWPLEAQRALTDGHEICVRESPLYSQAKVIFLTSIRRHMVPPVHDRRSQRISVRRIVVHRESLPVVAF